MKILGLLLFAILIIFNAASQDCRKLYDKAFKLYKSDKYDEALKTINSALIACKASVANDTIFSELLRTKGLCYYETDDYKSAISAFRASIGVLEKADLLHKWRRVWLNLGDTYSELEKLDSAEICYKKGIEYFEENRPNDLLAELTYEYGEVLKDQERFQEAKEAFQKSAHLYDSLGKKAAYYDALDYLAEVTIELEEYETAKIFLSQQEKLLIELRDKKLIDQEGCADKYSFLASNYYDIDNNAKAIEMYLKSESLYSGLGKEHQSDVLVQKIKLAQSYLDNKEGQQATSKINEALQLAVNLKNENKQAHCYYVMGDIQLANGKLELAEQSILKSKELYEKINPSSNDVVEAYSQLAELYKKQNLLSKEEECLLKNVQLNKAKFGERDSYAVACRRLGDAYKSSGQFIKGEKAYLESIRIYYTLNPSGMNYENSLQALADLYRINDMYEKADSAYRLCLELYEKNGEQGIDYTNVFYYMALNNEKRGDYKTAINQLEESLIIIKAKAGKERNYADALIKIADVFRSNGDYAKADNYYNQALKLVDSLKLTDVRVVMLRKLGGLYFDIGKKDEAFQLRRKALRLAEQEKLSSLTIANVQYELGAFHRFTFQFDSALYFYKQVEGVYRKEFGIISTAYTSILYELSQTYYYLGAMDSTENILKRRLEIFEVINPKSVSMATGLLHMAEFYNSIGKVKEAEKFYLDSYNLQKELTGPTMSLAGTLGKLGWFNAGLGNYSEAEKYYKQAIAMVESINGKDCIQYGFRLNEMGILFRNRGLYTKAEEMLLEYVKIEENKRGKTSFAYATARNNLGTLYATMGLRDKALQCYQDAVKINEAIYGRESDNYAINLSNLASAYRDKDNYQKADSLYQIVVVIRSKYFGPSHPKTIGTLSDLASFEKLQGKYQQSISHYNAVIDYRKGVYGEKNLNTLYALEGKGDLLSKMGNYKESLNILQPILPAYKTSLGENHPTYAGINKIIGLNFLNQYDFKQAATYLKTTLNVRFFQIDKTFSSLTEKQREDFYASIKLDFNLFNSFALVGAGKIDFMGKRNISPDPKLVQDLFNNQVATKALLLSSTARLRKQIISGSDKGLKEKFFEWEKLKTQLASLYQKETVDQKGDPNLKAKITRDSLEERIDKLERELSVKSERFAKAEDKKKYTWKDIQAKLKPGEAAIEVIRMQKYGLKEWILDESDPKKTRYPKIDLTDTILYAALIVTPETVAGPELVLFTEGNSMEGEFLKEYQGNIYLKQEDIDSYNRFWQPLASHPMIKGKIKKVYFSPDGIYNQISINSLFNPGTKKFVIDELDVQMVTNSKDILIARKSDEQNYYCMFIGNPSFYADKKSVAVKTGTRSYSLMRGGGLSSLPGAEREVDLIKDLLDSASTSWQVDILKGKEATESKIKTMDNPRVLHIATHGFFEQSVGVQGTRGAGAEVGEIVKVASGPRLNPMLASGLFLQGGGDALSKLKTFDYELLDREDGILTAYEAMNLNIENTELVILSACETGLGEVNNGEGVYGLQRALKVAGANSIVMSLWSVSDDATMILMKEFYKDWLKSGDKQASFREAQLAVRNTKSFAHPFFWSAFVMVGN